MAAKPYSIVTIDLKKAFDTVQHNSINVALRLVGVDQRIMKLIDNQYKDVSTIIICGNNHTGDIPIKRGVKQGDPPSPFIFNCILDEFLAKAHHEYGVKINNVFVSTIAYADDIILLSENSKDVQFLIYDLTNALAQKRLIINATKCTALSTFRVPSKKKLYVACDIFKCNGEFIPQIKIEDLFKYLGKNFRYMGIKNCKVKDIMSSLNNLLKAPLKPSQKLSLLKKYFSPDFFTIDYTPT